MERIAIIGTGLIGGSIGLALKGARLNGLEVIGYDLDRGTAGEAKRRGVVDRNAPNPAEAVRDAKMVIIATPPLAVSNVMQEISEHLADGAVVTDTASTKVEVRRYAQEFLPETVSFVGGHPMAGKEDQGIKNADAALFRGAAYCVIPSPQASEGAVKSVLGLVSVLGAEPLFIDAEEHDQYAAAISHMPLVASTALFSLVRNSPAWGDIAPLAAGGFRDTTRLASGDPRMSHDICATNADAVVHWLDRFMEELRRFREMILTDRKLLLRTYTESQIQRDAFVAGERPKRAAEFEMPSTKDAIGSMLLGNLVASKMDKLEKDMNQPGAKKPSVIDEDD
ncbi:MAG: prephenate dehydrogenase [Dehalococcoidia bacterium]